MQLVGAISLQSIGNLPFRTSVTGVPHQVSRSIDRLQSFARVRPKEAARQAPFRIIRRSKYSRNNSIARGRSSTDDLASFHGAETAPGLGSIMSVV
jgi:hypothetical protein